MFLKFLLLSKFLVRNEWYLCNISYEVMYILALICLLTMWPDTPKFKVMFLNDQMVYIFRLVVLVSPILVQVHVNLLLSTVLMPLELLLPKKRLKLLKLAWKSPLLKDWDASMIARPLITCWQQVKSLPQSFLITLVPELIPLIPNPKEANVLLIQTKFKNLVFQNKIDIWRVFIKLLQIEFREI